MVIESIGKMTLAAKEEQDKQNEAHWQDVSAIVCYSIITADYQLISIFN